MATTDRVLKVAGWAPPSAPVFPHGDGSADPPAIGGIRVHPCGRPVLRPARFAVSGTVDNLISSALGHHERGDLDRARGQGEGRAKPRQGPRRWTSEPRGHGTGNHQLRQGATRTIWISGWKRTRKKLATTRPDPTCYARHESTEKPSG